MYSLSKAYSVPPAEMIGVTDRVAAYCLNRAIWRFGTALENEVHEKTRKLKRDEDIANKSRQLILRWTTPAGETPRGMFRDPLKG